MAHKLIIDTDTASDDAIALIMALRAPEVEVEAITVVAGNVSVEQGTRNALYVVELCESDAPVYRGASGPLARDLVTAHDFHGADGLGEQNYPPPQRCAAEGDAVDILVQSIQANPGITLITLGPLTNIALAVARAPEIVDNVSRCVMMGGAANTVGNVTPAAEYNMWEDPEAARIVLHSGLPVEMVGWELCRGEAAFNDAEMADLRGVNTPLAHFALDCSRKAIAATRTQSGEPGMTLPDPIAVAVALDPTLCTRRSKHYVDVETNSELTRGMTVVDIFSVTHTPQNQAAWAEIRRREPNVSVCWAIDIPRWKAMLRASLR